MLLGLLWLAGCSQSMRAGMGTITQSWGPPPETDLSQVRLDPRLSYLRVQVDGERGPQVGLLVEGDRDPHRDGGETSVWYGADGSVLRLHQGRLVGWSDRVRSWRVVDETVLPGGAGEANPVPLPGRQVQVIDQQPGHRLGLRRQRAWVPSPVSPAGHSLQGSTDGLRWFTDHAPEALPDWLAIDMRLSPSLILYGQQCLEPRFCIRWQHWPPR